MTLNNSEIIYPDRISSKKQQGLDLNQEFEKLAFLTAQVWKDDHKNGDHKNDDHNGDHKNEQFDRNSNRQADFDACVLYVTTEMVTAARAVGGPAGLAIMTGSGSRAARLACQRVLRSSPAYTQPM